MWSLKIFPDKRNQSQRELVMLHMELKVNQYIIIPLVPHEAVAEVSRIGSL